MTIQEVLYRIADDLTAVEAWVKDSTDPALILEVQPHLEEIATHVKRYLIIVEKSTVPVCRGEPLTSKIGPVVQVPLRDGSVSRARTANSIRSPSAPRPATARG